MRQFTKAQESRLLELLNRETELARQILELAKAQSKMLEADDLDGFNASLDAGRELIEQINGSHQESEGLMRFYASYYTSGGGAGIGAIDEAAARFTEAIEQCSMLSGRNLEDARAKTEDFIKQIGSLSLKRKSLGLYAQGTGSSSQMFDRKT